MLAKSRIDQLDVSSAIEDILHFVRDQEAIRLLSKLESCACAYARPFPISL